MKCRTRATKRELKQASLPCAVRIDLLILYVRSFSLTRSLKKWKEEKKMLSFLIKIIQIFVSISEIFSCFLHLVEVYWFPFFLCVSSTKISRPFMSWPILHAQSWSCRTCFLKINEIEILLNFKFVRKRNF